MLIIRIRVMQNLCFQKFETYKDYNSCEQKFSNQRVTHNVFIYKDYIIITTLQIMIKFIIL